ncbi:MAG: hypothetical protein J5852_05115, partial [Clostridia bacterium]|nr:hypothetical protein [Clostridia bacterium]
MKKIVSVVVALLVFCLCLSPLCALAAGTPTFEISSAKAARTEGAEITISIKNNPGITSTKLIVSFDKELILKNVAFGSELGGFSQRSAELTSPLTLNWFIGTSELKKDAVFATLTFAADSSAKVGDYKISATYDENDVYNLKEENIKFNVVEGTFTVTGDPAPVLTGNEVVTATASAATANDDGAYTGTAEENTASLTVGDTGTETIGATAEDNSADTMEEIATVDADAETTDANDAATVDVQKNSEVTAFNDEGTPTGDGDYTGGEELLFDEDGNAIEDDVAEDGATAAPETEKVGGAAPWIGIAAAALIV